MNVTTAHMTTLKTRLNDSNSFKSKLVSYQVLRMVCCSRFQHGTHLIQMPLCALGDIIHGRNFSNCIIITVNAYYPLLQYSLCCQFRLQYDSITEVISIPPSPPPSITIIVKIIIIIVIIIIIWQRI